MRKMAKKPQRLATVSQLVVVARLQERIVKELRYATPSHSWDDMPSLWKDVQQVRQELEELANADAKK